jgi:ribose transport system substrate-binding protein
MSAPFLIGLSRGVDFEAKKLNPQARVQIVASNFDVGTQINQIEAAVALKVDLIIVDPTDPVALQAGVRKAHDAGIPVVAVELSVEGADAVVITDNAEAGRIACQFIINKLGGSGNVAIENGPPYPTLVERVKGCEKALSAAPKLKLLSDKTGGPASRSGGTAVTADLLKSFPAINAIFAVNDELAIGAGEALKQLNRSDVPIVSVGGGPEIAEELLSSSSNIPAFVAENPVVMGRLAMNVGANIVQGINPPERTILVPSFVVTTETIKNYLGWLGNPEQSGSRTCQKPCNNLCCDK